jgi:hypothetical protein
MIPLIKGLRKTKRLIKTGYDSNRQLINEMGDILVIGKRSGRNNNNRKTKNIGKNNGIKLERNKRKSNCIF